LQHRLLGIDRKNHVVFLTLNRPDKKNSLSPELVDFLLQTLQELALDDNIRTVVVRGAGDQAFCAGYDIGSLPIGRRDGSSETLETLDPIESLFKAIVEYPYPVIAMINGVAFGAGCELAV
jgi:enoyl-CoA hydratase/carnithine racemase